MLTAMRLHNLYFPRFVPGKELHRIDWGLQLVTAYQQVYQHTLPILPDPKALNDYLTSLLTELRLADQLLARLLAKKDSYHAHISLKNEFLYGRDGAPPLLSETGSAPPESLEPLAPGLFSRLIQLAYDINAHPACTDNIRQQLHIHNPGPPRPDPALAQVFPADHNDGYHAKFYLPFHDPIEQVRLDCRYGDDPEFHLVAITCRARLTDPRPFTDQPILRRYRFTPLDKHQQPIGILTDLHLVALLKKQETGD
jgi:hypothetical protein